ncbi:unnamed protein product [Arctogadus glacialis]
MQQEKYQSQIGAPERAERRGERRQRTRDTTHPKRTLPCSTCTAFGVHPLTSPARTRRRQTKTRYGSCARATHGDTRNRGLRPDRHVPRTGQVLAECPERHHMSDRKRYTVI